MQAEQVRTRRPPIPVSAAPVRKDDGAAGGFAILVVDSDPHSGAALVGELAAQGFAQLSHVAPGLATASALSHAQPAVVLFNHHHDRPDELLACLTAQLFAPDASVVGLGSTGPGVKFLRQWNRDNACLHAVLEKPLHTGQLVDFLHDLAERRRIQQELRVRADQLASLVPDGAEQALKGGAEWQEEMFEAAVVFTDIRRSSQLITSQPARAFFRVLNESLSAQGARVLAHRGVVIKYTGDGLMAVFRGMGRSHLAMRCALALAAPELQDPVGFGVGVAEGLVLAGLVGDFESLGRRQQYDVIGSTVHLAARLCALAEPGQIVATREVLRASRIGADAEAIGPQRVRGFPAPIECVALRASPQPPPFPSKDA